MDGTKALRRSGSQAQRHAVVACGACHQRALVQTRMSAWDAYALVSTSAVVLGTGGTVAPACLGAVVPGCVGTGGVVAHENESPCLVRSIAADEQGQMKKAPPRGR